MNRVANATSTLAHDPVCGMLVDVIRAAGPSALGEEVYYFCSRDCERRFNVAPEVYAAAGFAQQPAMCCSVATSRAGAASALRA